MNRFVLLPLVFLVFISACTARQSTSEPLSDVSLPNTAIEYIAEPPPGFGNPEYTPPDVRLKVYPRRIHVIHSHDFDGVGDFKITISVLRISKNCLGEPWRGRDFPGFNICSKQAFTVREEIGGGEEFTFTRGFDPVAMRDGDALYVAWDITEEDYVTSDEDCVFLGRTLYTKANDWGIGYHSKTCFSGKGVIGGNNLQARVFFDIAKLIHTPFDLDSEFDVEQIYVPRHSHP